MSSRMKLGRKAKETANNRSDRMVPYVRSLESQLSSARRELSEIREELEGRVVVSLTPFREAPGGGMPGNIMGVSARIYEIGHLRTYTVREARSMSNPFVEPFAKFDLSAENFSRSLKVVCNDIADQTGHILFSLLRNQR